MNTNTLHQVLSPPLRAGEDATVVLGPPCTFDTDPSAWSSVFTLARVPGSTPVIEVNPGTPSVTGSGPYTAVWTVTLAAADTADLAAGVHYWELARLDSGGRTVLAAGAWVVLQPVTDWPA